jgi:cellulose 1,4-beta-cellobiosidase
MGNTTFYGPGMTIDTTKPLTVITQFVTSDGTANGDLIEIRRKYAQGGKVYDQPTSNVAGISGNAINDKFCAAQKTVFGDTNYFATQGGLKGMGAAFKKGMVLVMSLWDDYDVNMHWLNSPYPETADPSKPGVARGTCSITSGKPADVESQTPGATVVYSNVRTGPFGTTYSGLLLPAPGRQLLPRLQPRPQGPAPPLPRQAPPAPAAPLLRNTDSAVYVSSSIDSIVVQTY